MRHADITDECLLYDPLRGASVAAQHSRLLKIAVIRLTHWYEDHRYAVPE
jgi:hypothetical protein